MEVASCLRIRLPWELLVVRQLMKHAGIAAPLGTASRAVWSAFAKQVRDAEYAVLQRQCRDARGQSLGAAPAVGSGDAGARAVRPELRGGKPVAGA